MFKEHIVLIAKQCDVLTSQANLKYVHKAILNKSMHPPTVSIDF